MSQPNNLLEKITLDGKEYNIKDTPEILAVIQQVRTQEKDKLYAEIQTKTAELTALKNTQTQTAADKAAKEADLLKASNELSALKATHTAVADELAKLKDPKKGKPAGEPEALTKDAVAELISAALATQKAENDKVIASLSGTVSDKIVSDYRDELLAKNKGLIIPKFLTGKTKAELDASLVEALAESKEYLMVEVDGKKVSLAENEKLQVAAAKAAEEKSKGTGNQQQTTFPASPGGAEPLTGDALIKNVKEMSPTEYAKHRDAIMKEAKKVPIKS